MPNKPEDSDLLLFNFHTAKSHKRKNKMKLMENHQISWYLVATTLLNPNTIKLLAKALMSIPNEQLLYNNLAASKCDAFWIAVMVLM